jgi:hypothetical protein
VIAEYIHDRDQEAYATVPQDMRKETWPLRSRGFRRWLRYMFYVKEKQRLGGVNEPAPLRETMIADALAQLEAKAMFEGVRRQAYRRVAEHDGRIYLDLCNKNWEVVEISAEGWRIVEAGEVPVRFVRSKGMDELPAPAGYGSVDSLRELLNLGDEGEHAFRLILAWLMQALRARGPYPVLVLLGERGSAKSTAARILRSLVDPSTVPLRTRPRTPHDLYIDATSSWVISLDNISSLPKWLSDVLCMLSTGGGFSTRTLFTDREQELFEAMRPVILNGITDVVTADDLVNRSLIVRLPALAKGSYRTEREIQRTLRDFRPLILNVLVDAAVEGLRRVDDVQVQALPRMGDFAAWAVATEEALDGEHGAFMRALGISDEEGAQQALETSPLAEPIYELARNAWPNAWEGTATALLQRLRDFADEELTHSKDWPRSASVLSRRLSRLATLFRDVGDIEIRQLPRSDTGGTRRWYIRLAKGGG